MGKNFTRALRHLRSNHKTTRLDEKKHVLNEIPTMNMSGVYSKNPPGFRYDPPSPAKRFIPDVDGNWPAGVPGTPGATEYIRPQGYWINDSDWETKFTPNMSNDSILESPTNTDGFIDAESGTVKTLLPPNSRSFILGPLVDGYSYNHGYDDFTTIGYIQKDTRQIVVLGEIQGHWDTTPHGTGYTARVWDGTSGQFTAYNSNFTLAMAQWFKDRMTANDFTKNFPYFYSGGVFQPPLGNQPPGSPGNMYGGNVPGTGGGGNDPSDGDGEAAVGSGGEPDIGTETPQGDPEGGGPDDLNLWGLNTGEGEVSFKPDLDWYKKNKKKPPGAPDDWSDMSDEDKTKWINENEPVERFNYENGRFVPDKNNSVPDVPKPPKFPIPDEPLGDPDFNFNPVDFNYDPINDPKDWTMPENPNEPSFPNFPDLDRPISGNNPDDFLPPKLPEPPNPDDYGTSRTDSAAYKRALREWEKQVDEAQKNNPFLETNSGLTPFRIGLNISRGILDNARYGNTDLLFKGLDSATPNYIPDFKGAVGGPEWFKKLFNGKKLTAEGPLSIFSRDLQYFTPDFNTALKYAGDDGLLIAMPRPESVRGFKNIWKSGVSRGFDPTKGIETLVKTSDSVALESMTTVIKLGDEGSEKALAALAKKAATTNKFASKAAKFVPFLNWGIAAADVTIRVKNGDYLGATLGGLSAIPGPVGWAMTGLQLGYDMAGGTEGIVEKMYGLPPGSLKESYVSASELGLPEDKDEYIKDMILSLYFQGTHPELLSIIANAMRGKEFSEGQKKWIDNNLEKYIRGLGAVYTGKLEKKGKIKESFTSSQRRILREVTQPLKEIKELPKIQKLEKYRPNFAGKYKPQNTPNVTASKKSDEMVKAKNAAGQTWRTKDKYWGGYESQERMNVVYDNVGHGNQYFDRIVNENLSKRNTKNRKIQEHLNIIAHEKAMRQLDSSFVSPFRSIQEQETLDAPKDPLYKKVAKRLNTEIDYPKKPSPKGYPDKPPVQLDPNTGMHPKYGKRYKYDKLDPQSAEAMPVQGNPEIDANVQKALDKRAKDRKIKNLTVNTTNEKVDWRETLEKRNVGESKKNFKNLRKDLQEQLYTNVTTGMKVGQTLKHIPSGQTFKTGGALGGTETLPSTFPIFGESEPAPDASFYPLQGYAKPMDMMRRKNRENLEDINARLDASQEFAQKVNSDVMMNARLSLDEFSDQIKAKDLAYEQRQKKIQVLQDKQDIVYNKYKPQLDVLNDKLEKIASKYFNPDTWGTDEKVNDDPEYKDLLKQMQKLSDAEDAENDPLQAEIDKLRSEADSGYQVPGSKEYKDMQRVSFDEWIKKVPPFAYGSKDNFLINDPETRWKYMDDWGNQGKRPMNLSRITALKTVLNPNTGKPYTDWHPEDPQSELGEYVSSKLKDIGEIQWDGYRGMGSSINPSELYRDVLSKGPAVLDIYMQELTVFEENMTGVNNLLEKDLKEVVKKLKKEYKKSSEINRITYKQAENLKYYKNYLEQIKNHKANISRVLPSIQNAFAGNFEPTPTPTPIKPPAGFDGDGDYIPSGEGTFDKDGNYYPPGFEDAIRTDQINNLDNKQIDTAVKDVGNSFGPNIGTGFRIFGDFITKGHNERFVADRKYLGKEYMNRQFFPNVSFDKNGTYVKNDVVVGSGQPAKYNEKTGMLEIRATFDFKKNAHEVESAIASEKGEKADWADRFARTGSEYALDAMVDPLPGVLKPLSGIVASHFISTAKMFGKGKTIPIVIKITPAELKNKNKKAYKELVELGVISKDK